MNGIIDPDDYSGISPWVLGGKGPHRDGQGTETQREMLYTYTKGGDILQKLDGLSFTVDAGKNNSDNVVIYVQVTDRARQCVQARGEGSDQLYVSYHRDQVRKENLSKEKPVNVVEENGTERGYYKAARTATVTITDRASTLDLDAVKFDISGQRRAAGKGRDPIEHAVDQQLGEG